LLSQFSIPNQTRSKCPITTTTTTTTVAICSPRLEMPLPGQPRRKHHLEKFSYWVRLFRENQLSPQEYSTIPSSNIQRKRRIPWNWFMWVSIMVAVAPPVAQSNWHSLKVANYGETC